MIEKDKLYSYVEKSIQQLKTKVNLDKANVYLKPKYVQTEASSPITIQSLISLGEIVS